MAAIKDPSKKLPVVDWVYGGAYIVGSKEQR
jgi:carboxylesterase type B